MLSMHDPPCNILDLPLRCSIQVLQQYFVKQGFSNTHHTALDMFANRMFVKAATKMKQTRLVHGLAMSSN